MQRKKTLTLIIVGVATVLILSVFMMVQGMERAEEVIATVNGEEIVKAEFEQRMQLYRGEVQSYFYQKHEISDSRDFWNTSYEGEVPIDLIKKKTLDDLVRIKFQQVLAKERRIATDISYQGFLKQLDEENRKRQTAVQNQAVIYGPVSFNAHNYFEYVFSNMVLELQKKLVEEGLLSNSDSLTEINHEYEQWIDKQLTHAEVFINDAEYSNVRMK